MRWNIEKRLLVLVLAAGILSFMTVSGLSFYGMSVIRSEMSALGDKVGEAGANFTESLITYQLKKTLGELAEARAGSIDRDVYLLRTDVEILSRMMTRIASNPEDYKPVKLLDPRFDKVHHFEPYIIYSPETFLFGMSPEKISPELRREIELAGNIGVYLRVISKSFAEYNSSFYVGSAKGYFICVSLYPETNGALEYSNDELYRYDCRERPWYKNAIEAGAPVFSDLYNNMDDDGYQLIGCSAPYYDSAGNVAGVVGLDMANTDIYTTIEDTAIGEHGFSFVLNKKGEVVLSSHTTGDLIATSGGQDLRKNPEQTLAIAARKMVDGQSGTFPVIVDGEEYFLAFAPMENIGWSFGTLTLKKDIISAANESRIYFLGQVADFRLRLQDVFYVMSLCAMILLMGLLYFLLTMSTKFSSRLIRPIHVLSDGVREIFQHGF